MVPDGFEINAESAWLRCAACMPQIESAFGALEAYPNISETEPEARFGEHRRAGCGTPPLSAQCGGVPPAGPGRRKRRCGDGKAIQQASAPEIPPIGAGTRRGSASCRNFSAIS